jgi:hypothetical protein
MQNEDQPAPASHAIPEMMADDYESTLILLQDSPG